MFDQRHRFTGNWVIKFPYGTTFSGIAFAASGQARAATVGGKDNRNNHDPATLNKVLSSPSFGRPGRSSSLPYLSRQIQFGAKFSF